MLLEFTYREGEVGDLPAKTSAVRKLHFGVKRLRVVVADPLIAVPGGDHDGGFFVEGRRGIRGVEDFLDLVGREHAGRAGTLACRGPRAVLEGAAGREARGTLHGEAAPVKSEPHVHPSRVYIVAPQEFKSQVDLGKVRMRLCIGPEALYCAVPDAVCRRWKSINNSLPHKVRGIALTDVVCHYIEEVDILLQIDNVEAT